MDTEEAECPDGVTRMTVRAMSDIVEFLLARIREDEARANYYDPFGMAMGMARLRAECQAKRAIIEHHELSDQFGTPARICLACTGGGEYNYAEASPCPTLRHLAAVYANHPDYREEWAR